MAGNRHSLAPALGADFCQIQSDGKTLGYYVAGDGPPLLLIHSINAAASAFEVRPVFDRFRETHRVYAPDLPGFGRSDRSDRRYSISTYMTAISDMLRVIESESGKANVDAMALSLSAEFLARVALDQPERLRRLAFVSPTGFDRRSRRSDGDVNSTRESGVGNALSSAPVLSPLLFRLLASPGSIRYFLRRTWGSDNVDAGAANYAIETVRQPGARHAPLAFVSGRLFSAGIRRIYEQLEQPIFLAHGSRGDFQDYSGLSQFDDRPDWRIQRYDAGALLYFEQPDEYCRTLAEFLAATDSR